MRNPLTPRKTFKRRLRATEIHLVDLEHRYSELENRLNVHESRVGVHYGLPAGTPILDGSDQNC